MNLPKGISGFLNDGFEHHEFTDKVLRTISEYYVVYKNYYDFDEAKFSLIAIDCAKNAKNENTFPSYFRYSLESELGIDVIEKDENLLDEIQPSPEFLVNEKYIREAFRIGIDDFYKEEREPKETHKACANDCIQYAIQAAGYPHEMDELWSWLPRLPIDAPSDYEEAKRKADNDRLREFNGKVYHDILYLRLLSALDHDDENMWILYVKNWKYAVELIYKEVVDRFREHLEKFDVDESMARADSWRESLAARKAKEEQDAEIVSVTHEDHE